VSDFAQPSMLARIQRVTSPEMIAGGLSVPVLAIALAVAMGAVRVPSFALNLPAAPSQAPIIAGPTASFLEPSSSPAQPTASATATDAAAWSPEARTLLRADSGLLAIRDRLSKILRDPPTDTSKISRQLRSMNTTLTATFRFIDALASKGAPADLVADVRAVHAATLQASLETLGGSLQNTAFYKAGTGDVIAALDDL
jgi:hypothetical protein